VDGNGRMGRLWQTRLLMEYHPIFEFLPVEDFESKNSCQRANTTIYRKSWFGFSQNESSRR
jgi:Fic family protein